jgi:hypothetical protein
MSVPAASVAVEATTTVMIVRYIAMSVTTPRKAKTNFWLCIHRGWININRLLANVNWLWAGGINNGLRINVNRLTCGLKRDTDTDFAAPVSRY